MKLTYAEQLRHPNWQRRRLEKLKDADWKCECCGDAESMLHVHHRRYFKGRMAWEYSDRELAVLCDGCHGAEHFDEEVLKRLLSLVPVGQNPTFNAISILTGFFEADVPEVTALAAEVGVGARFRSIGVIAAALRSVPEDRLDEVLGFVNSLNPREKTIG